MPPKLPIVSAEEAIRSLERLGFVQIRQRGSHVTLKKKTSAGDIGCVVPLHRELAIGTLRSYYAKLQLLTKNLWNICRMGIVHTRMLSPCVGYVGLPFSNKPV